MMGFAGPSLALFAAVWALMCVAASAVVTDALMRGAAEPSAVEAEPADGAPAESA